MFVVIGLWSLPVYDIKISHQRLRTVSAYVNDTNNCHVFHNARLSLVTLTPGLQVRTIISGHRETAVISTNVGSTNRRRPSTIVFYLSRFRPLPSPKCPQLFVITPTEKDGNKNYKCTPLDCSLDNIRIETVTFHGKKSAKVMKNQPVEKVPWSPPPPHADSLMTATSTQKQTFQSANGQLCPWRTG